MDYSTILYEVRDATAIIKLNRPDRMNAWNAAVAADLSRGLQQANDDDGVRAVVITGAGRAFCAGADLGKGESTFAGRERTGARAADAPSVHPFTIGKPVIAAINGAAVGVGMTYPMLCDVRVVAEDAKLGFVFTRRGMIPELACHLLLQRAIGFSKAAELLMSGRIFTGAEAASLGIASRAVPAHQVLDLALEMAAEYRHAAPVSVAITKRLLWEGLDSNVGDMMRREGPLFAWAGDQPDAREGIRSFIEKRPPVWSMSAARDLPPGFDAPPTTTSRPA